MSPIVRLIIIAALNAAATLGPALIQAPEAHAGELAFEVRNNLLYPTDESTHAVRDTSYMHGVALGVGYDLSDLVLSDLRVYLLLDAGGTTKSRFGGALQFDWSRNAFMLAADYGPEFFGFLRPSVRLGAGYVRQHLEISSSLPAVFDRAHDLAAMGAIGFEAFIPYATDPKHRGAWLGSFTVGVGGHFGYYAQTAASFDNLRPYGDQPWDHDGGDLGTLDPNGLFWNLGIVVRMRL